MGMQVATDEDALEPLESGGGDGAVDDAAGTEAGAAHRSSPGSLGNGSGPHKPGFSAGFGGGEGAVFEMGGLKGSGLFGGSPGAHAVVRLSSAPLIARCGLLWTQCVKRALEGYS